jgi:SAM-dependent methyltransferase
MRAYTAGDVSYSVIGAQYSRFRRPEPAIEREIEQALGSAVAVLNVGAGAGSYEPRSRTVTAVEPSPVMRAQRPPELPAAIPAVAEALPFADKAFDASMTTFSIHQWKDVDAGLREMRRVTRGPVVILTCDPERVRDFWLYDYAPGVLDAESRRYPSFERIANALGGNVDVRSVPIPLQCTDGFNEAYYGRPEVLLDPEARKVCSAWSFLDDAAVSAFEGHLRNDLDSGAWDAKHGHLRKQPAYTGSLCLITATP